MDMGTLNNRGSLGPGAPVSRTNDMGAAASTVAVDSRQGEELKQQGIAEPDREQLLAAVEEMQNFVQAAHHNIQFQLDDDSGRMLVKVTERDSGEVIRQIPSEEAVRLAENLSEIRSLLFSAEV